ncbi:MAG: TolC family protein [Deltaproteobacteria bacterium]|nr:TolC family protein [Candidatus Deferrimicrobiaceae bacterium]
MLGSISSLRRHQEVRTVTSIRLFLAVVLLASPLPVFAAEVPVSLDEAVRSAVEKNLDLRVETYNPAISDTDIRKAQGIYNPRLGALVDHRGENAPLDTSGNLTERRRFFDANFSTDFLLSTGATASAAFTNLWSRTSLGVGSITTQGTSISSFVEPKLSLTVTQPLLQGFGKEVTEQGITVAEYGKESSLLQWRNAANTTTANVRDQYFALIKARENLKSRKASLAAAQELDASNRARVNAGVLASVELLDSAFGLSQREVDLLAAEKNVRDASDRLRATIQYPTGSDLVPADAPKAEPVGITEEQAMKIALETRPDLRVAQVALKTQELNTRVARNAALPALGLIGSAGLEALRSGYPDAVSDLASAKTPFWSVGLSFSYPIGNDAAEAALAASQLRTRQADAQIKSLEDSIRLDVRTAIRALDTAYRQIESAQKGVELGEARLESFIKRQKVGLAVTKDVLDAEANLTTARETLAAARADYQSAVTQLWKATGELLERQGLKIDDKTIDTLAWKGSR